MSNAAEAACARAIEHGAPVFESPDVVTTTAARLLPIYRRRLDHLAAIKGRTLGAAARRVVVGRGSGAAPGRVFTNGARRIVPRQASADTRDRPAAPPLRSVSRRRRIGRCRSRYWLQQGERSRLRFVRLVQRRRLVPRTRDQSQGDPRRPCPDRQRPLPAALPRHPTQSAEAAGRDELSRHRAASRSGANRSTRTRQSSDPSPTQRIEGYFQIRSGSLTKYATVACASAREYTLTLI
jgi:hypothetical protein